MADSEKGGGSPRSSSPHPQYSTIKSEEERLVHSNSGYGDDDDDDDTCCDKCCAVLYPSGFKDEFRSLFQITWPIVLTQIGQMIIGPLSLIFCGHLGDPIQLDGAALAISMINATCIAVGQGLGTACDTFFSQSFGSRNKKQVGAYLQRALCIFALAIMPCFALHINMEAFLVALGQHPEVSKLAGRYLLIFLPGALSFFMYVVLSKYIQNQNIVMPNVVIGLVANLVNAGLHYLLLYQLNWGTDGSAVAQSASYFLLFLLTLIYILVSKVYQDTWDGWSIDCLTDWGKFMRLCIPGMLMLCMEWWGFEIGVFMTGLLGTTELGAQSVLLQIDSIWFQVPLGIQIACAIRVGQHLGAGNGVGAKTAARLSLTIIIFLSFVAVALFLGLRYQLPYLFTNVTEIAELTGDLLPIVAIYVFFDGVATACKGVLYGTGRQLYGAALLFVSYYLLALPTGIPLMFLTDLGPAGYWWALAGNLVIQAVVLFAVVTLTKWDQQVERAYERAGLMGEPTGPDPLLEEDEEEEEQQQQQQVHKKQDEEKQPLLSSPRSPQRQHSSTRRRSSISVSPRRQRNVSITLSVNEINTVIALTQPLSRRQLLCRRGAALLVCLCILGGGVAVRLLVDLPESSVDVTVPGNSTTVVPVNSTVEPGNDTLMAVNSLDFLQQ